MVKEHFFPSLTGGGYKVFFFRVMCYRIIKHNLENRRIVGSNLKDCLNKDVWEIINKYGSYRFYVTKVNKTRFRVFNLLFPSKYEIDIFQPFGMISLIIENYKCKEAIYLPYNDDFLEQTYKDFF